jgi:hypothetical protein
MKNNFLKIKKIIDMYFGMKSYLKSNNNYITKQAKKCGNCTREGKKYKKRKGINVVFSVKWINCLIIFSSFIYLY